MRELPAYLQTLYPFKSDRYYEVGKGIRMHYLDEGSGEPVVMVHGNPTWSFYYRNLILSLRGHCRCIVPDHIGCGLSDKPQLYPYVLQQHIDNLIQLLDHLQIQRFHLIVHDWGGAIGLALAEKWLTRIRTLTVLNSAAYLAPHMPFRIGLCRVPLLGPLLVRGFNAFARAATWMAPATSLSQEVKAGYLYPYDNWDHRVAILRFVEDIPMSHNHPSYKTLESIEHYLWTLQHKPTLIAWGMKDFCFTPDFLDVWIEHFPKARILKYPQAGHYVLEDAAEELIPEIRKFIIGNTPVTVATGASTI